jgi:hypothetical protein
MTDKDGGLCMSWLNKSHGKSIVRRAKLILSISSIIAGSGFLAAAAQNGPAASPNAPAVSVFSTEAGKLGVRQCVNLYSALGQMVSLGSDYTVVTQTEPSAPDAHGVQGVVGMTYSGPDHSGQGAGVVLAAPVGNACEGQVVRVAPFERSCTDTVALLPAGSAPVGSLSGVPLYDLGNQGQALLVSSGSSCVVVTVARAAEMP